MVLAVKADTSRRSFLVVGGWATLAAGGVLAARLVSSALGGRRSVRRLTAVGPLASLAIGGRLSAPGVIVLRDERGVAAVSSRCTHLGCTITSNARGFECACHGSAFSGDGRVLRGPATAPLPWYQVILGEDDVLRVDLDTVVDPATRLDPSPRPEPETQSDAGGEEA